MLRTRRALSNARPREKEALMGMRDDLESARNKMQLIMSRHAAFTRREQVSLEALDRRLAQLQRDARRLSL